MLKVLLLVFVFDLTYTSSGEPVPGQLRQSITVEVDSLASCTAVGLAVAKTLADIPVFVRTSCIRKSVHDDESAEPPPPPPAIPQRKQLDRSDGNNS